MQNVLIVKNDELFLNTMSDRLALNDSVSFLERIGHNIPTGFFDLEVYKSLNGQQAIKILGQYPIDIVITDLKMPKINGFELILHMNNHYPNTPIIVLTDIAPITMNKYLCEDGISHYIERPFSLELIKKSIVEVLILKLLNPDHCVYSGISISSLMQLISTAKMTYTIYIKESENIGRLYMLYGKLIGAETKNNKGEDAVYEMFGWKKPMLLLEPSCNNAEETIKVSLMQILKKSLKALHGLDKISSDKLLKQETPQGEKSQQVKSLYRKLAKRFHPDLNADFSEEMKNYWLLITDAYNKGEVENLKILSLITSNLFKESTRLHTENSEDQQEPVEDQQFEETRKLEEQEPEKHSEEISEAD
ncbi:MAG: response regulator, partial [Candidatus Cloacimonetes bacterium]|nr:response regulator [Candidatus Cloacimonadota bacterium]